MTGLSSFGGGRMGKASDAVQSHYQISFNTFKDTVSLQAVTHPSEA